MRLKPPPGKKLVADWVGLRVRLRVTMTSQIAEIPAGTMMTVKSASPGLSLQGDKCSCCGISPRISRVDSADVEVYVKPPEPTMCGCCWYDEADGELMQQCPKCKATDAARAA